MHTGFKPNEDNPDIEEESAESFLRAPKTPDLKGKKPHFLKTPLFDSYDFNFYFDSEQKVAVTLIV